MMSEVLHKRVELLANASIILVSLLISFTLVRDRFLSRPQVNADGRGPVNQDRAGANLRRGPMPGQKVSLPNVDWGKSKQTLLLVVSNGCHFCTESAGFYQKIARENMGRNDLRLMAVLPQDVETGKGYLNKLGVSVGEVIQAPLGELNVRGTPTLMLVDDKGVVKNIWLGRLPTEKEEEVLSRMKSVS